MEKYKRFYGVSIFIIAVILLGILTVSLIKPMYSSFMQLREKAEKTQNNLERKIKQRDNIKNKLTKLKTSIMTSQKKIYSPLEDKLGSDTLFFTLYSDLIDMVHSNSIKIKSIDYVYNPEGDTFVAQEGNYFVCDVNMELVSNYTSLGKLIQDIYQYPYYIKINDMEVVPYPKDKKILLSSISVRLYAHTSPEEEKVTEDAEPQINGASLPIPQ